MFFSLEEIALSLYVILIIMKVVTLYDDCTMFSSAMLFQNFIS